MDRKHAANILYKATHDQPVPIEALIYATKWFCEKYHNKSVKDMKTWSESAALPQKFPYQHVDFSG